jgi:hypothetical protein
MLAEIVLLEPSLHRRHQRRALLHQLQPQFLRRRKTHGVIVRVLLDHVLQFRCQVAPGEHSIDGVQSDPVVLLRRHIRCRNHTVVRIDEPQHSDAAVAGAGWIYQFERLHAVLQGVWEGQQAAFFALHAAEVLDRGFLLHSLGAEDFSQGAVVVLFVC